MTDREGKADSQPFHLILLAKDWTGYQNLCRLVTDAHLDGYYYKPRIDREHLAKYSEGLVGLSRVPRRRDPAALEADDWDLARKRRRRVPRHLRPGPVLPRAPGPRHPRAAPPQRAAAAPGARGRASRSSSPTTCTTSIASSTRRTTCCCASGTGNNLDTPNRMKFETQDFYLKSAAEMAALFPDQPEALAQHAPDRRDVRPAAAARPAAHPALPGARRRDGRDAGCARSASAASSGATARSPPELQPRLDYELGVIISMGYAGYFLIVADFVRFAREQGIATTCRGSAPGSIVTYTLGITPVDPIDYELPFERFLNPDRVTMPDIDVDFEDEPPRRGHRLRHAQVRLGPRRPDHHLRHDARPGRDPRRRPRAGPGLRRGRPDRQGRPQPARASSSTRRSTIVAPAQGDVRRRHPGRAADRLRASSSRASRATRRPTPRASSSAASR